MIFDISKFNYAIVNEKNGRFYKFVYDNKRLSLTEFMLLFNIKYLNFNTRNILEKYNIPYSEIDLT
jgi:hypothetical protein